MVVDYLIGPNSTGTYSTDVVVIRAGGIKGWWGLGPMKKGAIGYAN